MNDNETDRPAEDDNDVEGHGIRRAFTDQPDDDVAGHLSGALGAQKRDDQA
jgi:hypothetical protein